MADSRRPFPVALALVLALLSGTAATPPQAGAAQEARSGFRALSGRAAANFKLPADVRLGRRIELTAMGLTVERYQQQATRHQALVEGGQLTVYRRDGVPVLVIGAHYPGASATNRLVLEGRQAVAAAAADRKLDRQRPARPPADELPPGLERRSVLNLEPRTGRLFYRVESFALGLRQFHSVDAETGVVFEAVDAVAHDHGTGVKADGKSLGGAAGQDDDLTSRPGSAWRMTSVDRRLVVYDARNGWGIYAFPSDADNHWATTYQRAAVDAQYYARATDDYLRRQFGFDLLDGCGYAELPSVVHTGSNYANAFWDGRYLVYGDGDGQQFRSLSGAQDIVSHELVHALTECTSGLQYQDEPGALNEAFSDIMATAVEHALAEPNTSRCRRATNQPGCPDWWIAEDAWIGGGAHGIRSLAVPGAGDQPSHDDARYTGSMDNGGVHINSGIANHAFYLLAQGGRNARCSGPSDADADCDVLVPGVGLAQATAISFLAYVGLPADASFCAARSATIAAADALHPGSASHSAAAALSWAAVGLDGEACEPPAADFTASLERRVIHAAPGGAAVSVSLRLTRASETGDIEFSLAGVPADWHALQPVTSAGPDGAGTTITIAVPGGAAEGVRPIVVSAASGARTERLPAVVVVDGTPPTVTQPRIGLRTGVAVPLAGGVPARTSWTASDAVAGLAEQRLQVSVDGGPWRDAAPPTAASAATTLVGAGLHRYRVRVTDAAGNAAVSPESAPLTVAGYQERAARYSSGWSAATATQGWGSVRYARTSGRTATFRFVGREVAWVAPTGPRKGKARVYIDGTLVARVNLYSATTTGQRVVFVASGLSAGVEHRLRVVTIASSSRPRVDVDGFLVLNR